MSRARAFFLEEAAECLGIARAELDREAPDRVAIHRAVRRLRGSAELARFRRLAERTAALERRLRPQEDDRMWTPALGVALADGLGELESALHAVRAGETQPQDETETQMDGESRADGVVAMDELEYQGTAALERALELRQALEDAIVTDEPAGPLLDELFDLIRLGMK